MNFCSTRMPSENPCSQGFSNVPAGNAGYSKNCACGNSAFAELLGETSKERFLLVGLGGKI